MSTTGALMIAGTASGVGKTSISVGVMAAMTSAGSRVGAAKVGPDYIDPGFHRLATGRPSYNLDLFMTGARGVSASFARVLRDCDICVVEGVMGLFDGSDLVGIDADNPGARLAGMHSSYEVARLLGLPVVLVVDARSASHSLAATASGFDSAARGGVAGVIVNRFRSERHLKLIEDGFAAVGIRIVGAVRDGSLPAMPSRHLGLVPGEARLDEARRDVIALGEAIAAQVDLGALSAIARTASARPYGTSGAPSARTNAEIRIAVAQGPAFSFTYQENLDILSEAGAELLGFDPVRDDFPIDADAALIGGGFPEMHLEELAGNWGQMQKMAGAHLGGMPLWAECGGMMLLAHRIDDTPGLGILPIEVDMSGRLTLGYRNLVANRDSMLFASGTRIYAHEFHYSLSSSPGDLLAGSTHAAPQGFGGPRLYAGYPHIHLGAQPRIAERFISAAALFSQEKKRRARQEL